MSQRPEVLIVTHGNWSLIYRLPGLLHRGGCRISAMAWKPNRLSRSRYVAESFAVEPDAPGGLMGALRAHLEQRPDFYRWIIFADEMILADTLPHLSESWLRPWLPAGRGLKDTERILNIVRSKTAFVEAAQEAGIPIPDSRIAATADEACAAAQSLGYPVVLKAAIGFGGIGVRRAENDGEAAAAFDAVNGGQPAVVQSFIEGKVGSTSILFNHGRALGWCSSYKHECMYTGFGPSCARHFMDHADMGDIVEKIGRLTGFHGFCGFDWMHRTTDDTIKVLEFNPRPTATIHHSFLAGVDFTTLIPLMFKDESERPAVQPKVPPGRPIIVYLFPQHLVHCLSQKDWLGLARWIPGVSRTDILWDEPRLLMQQLPKSKVVSLTWQRLKGVVRQR